MQQNMVSPTQVGQLLGEVLSLIRVVQDSGISANSYFFVAIA